MSSLSLEDLPPEMQLIILQHYIDRTDRIEAYRTLTDLHRSPKLRGAVYSTLKKIYLSMFPTVSPAVVLTFNEMKRNIGGALSIPKIVDSAQKYDRILVSTQLDHIGAVIHIYLYFTDERNAEDFLNEEWALINEVEQLLDISVVSRNILLYQSQSYRVGEDPIFDTAKTYGCSSLSKYEDDTILVIDFLRHSAAITFIREQHNSIELIEETGKYVVVRNSDEILYSTPGVEFDDS